NVSWLYSSSQFDEHPPDPGKGPMGNVTTGMQWTVNQVNAIVKGRLWPRVAIFITWDDWGDGTTTSTRPTSRLGSWRLHSHPTREHSSVMARESAAWCSAPSRDPDISLRSYTRTSVLSVSANPFSDCPR